MNEGEKMTLYRQLILFTLVLFLILFSGTWFAKFKSTRTFLTEQLTSHAQDTATSLALSITPHVTAEDLPAVESMINALFDRGYYETIRFQDIRGRAIIERRLSVKIENLPQWFIRYVPLEAPEASANVMAGWRQAGAIYVKSHPGYAYHTLWNDMVTMALWFVACLIFVLAGGIVGLNILLKPLYRVEKQADALCRKEYEMQEELPWTRELRRVVQAMNRMTAKIREMFAEQAAQAERLRERAYQDTLTGMGNRRLLEARVNSVLERQEPVSQGALILVRLNDLNALNMTKGFQAGDTLLQRIGELIRESFTRQEEWAMARLTGGEFAIFMPEAMPWEGNEAAEICARHLRQAAAEQLALTENVGQIGVALFSTRTSLGRLLSEADAALADAAQSGANAWMAREIKEEDETWPQGQLQWKAILEKALLEGRVSLDAQPVVKADGTGRVIHREILSRIIRENGERMTAGVFLPYAERLKLVASLDRIVLEKAMRLISDRPAQDSLAVNLSPASLQDTTFKHWIESVLPNLPAAAPRLIFEFSEFAAVQHSALIGEFVTFARRHGHRIGLDHYGRSFSHLGYLRTIRPDYVKIDKAYTAELHEEGSDARFYIGALCSVAHSIDIEVIAEGVETAQQEQILRELKIDGLQGYLIARPAPAAG